MFAVSGCGVLPKVMSSEEGFVGAFDIDRYTNRTYIGYNPEMGKIVLCVSSSTTLARAGQVLSDLGCVGGLALDGGGSATMIMGGERVNKTSGSRERNVSDIVYFTK